MEDVRLALFRSVLFHTTAYVHLPRISLAVPVPPETHSVVFANPINLHSDETPFPFLKRFTRPNRYNWLFYLPDFKGTSFLVTAGHQTPHASLSA